MFSRDSMGRRERWNHISYHLPKYLSILDKGALYSIYHKLNLPGPNRDGRSTAGASWPTGQKGEETILVRDIMSHSQNYSWLITNDVMRILSFIFVQVGDLEDYIDNMLIRILEVIHISYYVLIYFSDTHTHTALVNFYMVFQKIDFSFAIFKYFLCAGCSDLVEEAISCSRQGPPHQLSISLVNNYCDKINRNRQLSVINGKGVSAI